MENNQQTPPAVKPSSNLVWGILTTIFCCVPFGIVSIVHAAKVDSLWNEGKYQEACDAAKSAGTWACVSAIIGIALAVLYVIMTIVEVNSASQFYYY